MVLVVVLSTACSFANSFGQGGQPPFEKGGGRGAVAPSVNLCSQTLDSRGAPSTARPGLVPGGGRGPAQAHSDWLEVLGPIPPREPGAELPWGGRRVCAGRCCPRSPAEPVGRRNPRPPSAARAQGGSVRGRPGLHGTAARRHRDPADRLALQRRAARSLGKHASASWCCLSLLPVRPTAGEAERKRHTSLTRPLPLLSRNCCSPRLSWRQDASPEGKAVAGG